MIWLWIATVVAFLLWRWYLSLKRIVRFQTWKAEQGAWMDEVDKHRIPFHAEWPRVES